MRLLHTKTFELHSFIGDSYAPLYAILSHTWGEGEVTFEDMSNTETRTQKPGWNKIVSFCQRAAADGWDYGWIDTCCINKTDATELSEAINSMFKLYEEAQICYAYLADVPPRYALSPSPSPSPSRPQGLSRDEDNGDNSNKVPWKWYFRGSKWFTRGWTLQELLAPSFLLFLDQTWGDIGSREEWAAEIHTATGIETKQLWDFNSCSIATKLSWASGRRTTRVEDRAYSLLGLLGVNMPLVYGEGKRAFVRLQYELIRTHNDESIFAWGDLLVRDHVLSVGQSADILASSPEDFQFSGDLVAWPFDKHRRHFTMTNGGIHMNAEIFEYTGKSTGEKQPFALRLNCTSQPCNSRRTPIVIFLYSLDSDHILFERAGRIFRDWSVINTVGWKSLGRRDIIITHQRQEPLDCHHQESSPSYSIYFDVRSLGTLRNVGTRWYTCTSGGWNCVDTASSSAPSYHDKIDVNINGNGAIMQTITRARYAALGEAFAIVVKSGPRAPQFGIWRTDGPSGRVIERLRSDSAKHEGALYPTVARSYDGKIVRISARPVPPSLLPRVSRTRQSVSSSNIARKAFLVEVVVEAAERDVSGIGRFMHFGSIGSNSSATFSSEGKDDKEDSEGVRGKTSVSHKIKLPQSNSHHHTSSAIPIPTPSPAPVPTPAPASATAPPPAPASARVPGPVPPATLNTGVEIHDNAKKPKPKIKTQAESFTNPARASHPITPRPMTPNSIPRRPAPFHPHVHVQVPAPLALSDNEDYHDHEDEDEDDVDILTPTETESENSALRRPHVNVKKLRFANNVKKPADDKQTKQQQQQTYTAPPPPPPPMLGKEKRERRRSWIPSPLTPTTTPSAARRRQNPFFAGAGMPGMGPGMGPGADEYEFYGR